MFHDRIDAGRQLAEALADLRQPDRPPLVLGIPRGGVIVAGQVAHALAAPLDIVLAHKLGAPDNPELALGAVTEDGTRLVDDLMVWQCGLPPAFMEAEVQRQLIELQRRAELYRRGRARLSVRDRVVIVIDDGVATGWTLLAAVQALAAQQAARVIAAVPVGAAEPIGRLERAADEVVVLIAPRDFYAVSQFYRAFPQVTDAEVAAVLAGN